LPVKIIDAAGIRSHHGDCVEREGVRRALDQISMADLVLFLVDGSTPLQLDDYSVAESIGSAPFVLVSTKADLPQKAVLSDLISPLGSISVSTRSGEGIELLTRKIFSYFVHLPDQSSSEFSVVSNVRHRDALDKSVQFLYSFSKNRMSDFAPEILSLDLRSALTAIGEVTGESSTDELLDIVFSSFCIGK
jgi:tRNA modification GTPase